MKEDEEWKFIKDEPIPDSVEVLVFDHGGNMYLVSCDENCITDQHGEDINFLIGWRYKPNLPMPRGIITNDKWIELALRQNKGKDI